MDRILFERNLLALSARNPALCSNLSFAETTREHYRFLTARTGDVVPALIDSQGAARPLHSLVDPRREGQRLLEATGSAEELGDDPLHSANNEGFLIFFGLGGGFYIAPALEKDHINLIVVVEYNIHSIAELLASCDYIPIFKDPRFHLLVDPEPPELEEYILSIYKPALFGGIRLIPNRPRVEISQQRYAQARAAVDSALARLSGDYSVQAFFGSRWFSNIIRNCLQAEHDLPPLPPIREAAICAAGPSLDEQLPALKTARESRYLLATDTSLPALLQEGITPDGVISIDCQHISYYHFMQGLPQGIPLFLDLASPPLLYGLSQRPYFFSSGHPLTRYIARYWREFPEMDTSGGNVTYAAVSLAEKLGARRVELYGADYGYPRGNTYARGTYMFPHFGIRQNRLATLESLFSSFLFRSRELQKVALPASSAEENPDWYYETPIMRNYRIALERKAASMDCAIIPIPGKGAPLQLAQDRWKGAVPRFGENPTHLRLFGAGKAEMSAANFLWRYRDGIARLPDPRASIAEYLANLEAQEAQILTTLLPTAAALKRWHPAQSAGQLVTELKAYSLEKLDRVIARL